MGSYFDKPDSKVVRVSAYAEGKPIISQPEASNSEDAVAQTRYCIDTYQKTYFVIDGFDQLFKATVDPDFGPIYYRMKGAESIPAGSVLDTDRVFNRGSGEGWLADGDV